MNGNFLLYATLLLRKQTSKFLFMTVLQMMLLAVNTTRLSVFRFIINYVILFVAGIRERVSKVTLQEAASPYCHPSWWQMDSSDLDPNLINGSLDTLFVSPSKRHLDRFSRFFTAHPCAQHTNTQSETDAQTTLYVRYL